MKRPLCAAALAVTIALCTALAGCGSDEPSSPGASSATSQASSSPGAAASSPAPTASQVCADLAKQSAPILMKALKNADKPAEVSAAYEELADLYEGAVAKVESPEAKDAFSSLAKAYRNVAKNGAGTNSDELNKANEKFGAACFG